MQKIKKLIFLVFENINFFLRKFFLLIEYDFEIKYKKREQVTKNKLNLNIGAGKYEIENFISLDFYSDHYYQDKNKFFNKRVKYDLREDKLPYQDNTVDNIYCSHVIEHIEDNYVKKFINESFRVLKPNGVLRIACPDGKFLFNVSTFSNDYWNWRKKGSFSKKKRFLTDWNKIEQLDYLIREFSTPFCRFYNNKINNDLPDNTELKKLNYKEFINILRNKLTFRHEHPGDHINVFDYEILYNFAKNSGFKHVIESKKQGSVSIDMQGLEFDKTEPQMSLYVEMIK